MADRLIDNNSGDNFLLLNAEYYDSDTESFRQGHILAADGVITGIFAEAAAAQAAAPADAVVFDAAGLQVLPGVIDTHVHVREPGRPDKEDFVSGSAAALAGGVTTICQMPNVTPQPRNTGCLLVSHDAARDVLCDVAFYAAAGCDNVDSYPELARAGVCGLKTFLQAGRPGEQYINVGTDEELRAMLTAAASLGLRHFFHCEDYDMIGELEAAAHAAGEEGYSFHYKTRPVESELSSVLRVLRLARETGAAVGIVHVSTVAAAEAIRAAKAEGLDVTCEVCFHHLFMDDSWLDRFGPYAKCNPPLRPAADVAGLWEFVNDGTVDYIGSDHAPHLPSEKQQGAEQVWLAPSGIAHIELMLPLLLTAVSEGRLTMERLAELTGRNAYKVMGLYPQKGRIAVGADADFTIVDTGRKWTFAADNMYTRAKENAHLFDGMALVGAVAASVLRGRVMMQGGKVDMAAVGYGEVKYCHQAK